MNWVKKPPSLGDMVRVRIGSIYHFGVCVGSDEIVQFGLAPSLRADIPDSEIEVVSLYMVVAWYDQKINSMEHIMLYVGTKDEKWTNQREHLRTMRETCEMYRLRARKYFRNYCSKNNDYLGG